jgi:hypothetical protein
MYRNILFYSVILAVSDNFSPYLNIE